MSQEQKPPRWKWERSPQEVAADVAQQMSGIATKPEGCKQFPAGYSSFPCGQARGHSGEHVAYNQAGERVRSWGQATFAPALPKAGEGRALAIAAQVAQQDMLSELEKVLAEHPHVRAAALRASLDSHLATSELVLAALRDREARVREVAAEGASAFLGDRAVTDALRRVAADDQSDVIRAAAADSLNEAVYWREGRP